MRAYNMPGSFTSAVYFAAPVTFSRPSRRGVGLPIEDSFSFTGIGGGSATPTVRGAPSIFTPAIPPREFTSCFGPLSLCRLPPPPPPPWRRLSLFASLFCAARGTGCPPDAPVGALFGVFCSGAVVGCCMVMLRSNHFFATDGAPMHTDSSQTLHLIGVHPCPI